MIDELKPLLQQLPEPAPPSSISPTVMARIARDAEARAGAQTVPLRHRERPVWLLAVAGVAMVFMVAVTGWLSTGLPSVMSARIGMNRTPMMPVLDPALSAVLGVSFLIYLAGLFAPLRRGSGPYPTGRPFGGASSSDTNS